MPSLFRSESMKYVHLMFAEDAAQDVMTELGKFGRLHLVDKSGGAGHEGGGVAASIEQYQYYKKRVAACAFWEKKLHDLRTHMLEHQVEPPSIDVLPVELKFPDVLEAIKNWLEPLEDQLTQNLHFRKQQSQRINEQMERSYVLENCKDIQIFRRGEEVKMRMDESRLEAQSMFTTSLCGVIPVDRQPYFERMIFRMSRGNAITKFIPIAEKITDPLTGEDVSKTVFTVVFVGEQLKQRIMKVCNYVGATVYPVPADPAQFQAEVKDIDQRMAEYSHVLEKTNEDIAKLLQSIAFSDEKRPPPSAEYGNNYNTFGDEKVSPLVNWESALLKEKAVCDALRKCDLGMGGSKVITAEGWVPVDELENLQVAIRTAGRRTQEAVVHVVDNPSMPPTFFRTTRFTSPFQGIVNTYGTPRYQEANPGLFTIITFPFLFGVMYGDIGHGACLTLLALYFIRNEKKLEKLVKQKKISEIIAIAFEGRYLLVLMGAMAIFCGSIYNDCVSIPWFLYDSMWKYPDTPEGFTGKITAIRASSGVYPWGLDPHWFHTDNELTFFNSLKMKLSVVLGVIQMLFGLVLSLMNHLYFKDYLAVWLEFIPQMLFMLCTFGHMIMLIYIKLCKDWSRLGTGDAPNLIQTMIQMFLNGGKADPELFTGQSGLQSALVIIALLSVPVLFLGKPLASRYMAKKPHAVIDEEHSVSRQPLVPEGHDELKINGDAAAAPARAPAPAAAAGGHDEHGGSFGDQMISQSIHTIEYILGAVSNTASYLRLWALSLAHAELSSVFWQKLIMQYGLQIGPIGVVIGVGAWAGATFAVLGCMDSLECFLHALRLHWVEFQSKFFHADGYSFKPFDFNAEEEAA